MISFQTDVGMPVNALSDAYVHLVEILITVKTIAVWSDYT